MRTSEAVAPAAGVWFEVTPEVVLVYTPSTVACTSTRMVQLLLGGSVVAESVREVWFTAPWALGIVPVHVPRPPPMKFCAPVVRIEPGACGKLSVNVTLVSATEFGLVSVKVIVETARPDTLLGENCFVIVGASRTLR